MKKYSKSFILCGELDYLCLLCEEIFQCTAAVERHIRWEIHRKRVKDAIPKFNSDCIFKINNQYFCVICNTTIPTVLNSSCHINDTNHKKNKENFMGIEPQPFNLLTRQGSKVIVYNYIITDNEWNGIIDDTCILCSMDKVDAEVHKILPSHVKNLIEAKVQCNIDRVYRQIGDIFYCFSCKELLSLSGFDEHWASYKHMDRLVKKEPTDTIDAGFKNSNSASTSYNPIQNAQNTNVDIFSELKDYQKESIDINFERSTAICRKCNFSLVYTAQAINEHIKLHKRAEETSPGFHYQHNNHDKITKSEVTSYPSERINPTVEYTFPNIDHGKIRAELAAYGRDHNIKLNSGGSKGYCSLCDIQISAHIKNFKQHVQGIKHVENSKLGTTQAKISKPEYKTKKLTKYMRNIFLLKETNDFWINRNISVDAHSFMLICPLELNGKYDRTKCYICNKIFPNDEDQAHCKSMEHQEKVFDTNVVTSLEGEFVREICPKVFHCGFCNEVFTSWVSLKMHLRDWEHRQRFEQQTMIADLADDMFGSSMDDTLTLDSDILWMRLMGKGLF